MFSRPRSPTRARCDIFTHLFIFLNKFVSVFFFAIEAGAITEIATLLNCENNKVLVRAVGTIHNISSDAYSVSILRDIVRIFH